MGGRRFEAAVAEALTDQAGCGKRMSAMGAVSDMGLEEKKDGDGNDSFFLVKVIKHSASGENGTTISWTKEVGEECA
jgi:hypothetical protein